MLMAVTLTPAQELTVDHYRSYSVPASWFLGEVRSDGKAEVIALGENFVWSFLLDPDGNATSSEAEVGEFSNGITV